MIILLNKLEKLERSFGMLGTIMGIAIILVCFILSVVAIKFIVQLNINVIAWVCENFWGFKLY